MDVLAAIGRNTKMEGPRSAGEAGVFFTAYSELAAQNGPVAPYLVKLRLADRQAVDPDRLIESISRRSALRATILPTTKPLMLVAFPDLVGELKDGTSPYAVMVIDEGSESAAGDAEPDIRGTWDWPEARSMLSRAPEVVFVSDHMGAAFDPAVRFAAYHAVLATLVEQLRPLAIDWLPAQRIVKPERYLAALGDEFDLFDVMVGIRSVRLDGTSPQEFIIDSIGMAHFGLPDIQIHFNDPSLAPGRVGALAKNVAWYLRERGDIIQDGEWVDGLDRGERWYCRHEMAMIGPTRFVLDIDPGPHGPARRKSQPVTTRLA